MTEKADSYEMITINMPRGTVLMWAEAIGAVVGFMQVSNAVKDSAREQHALRSLRATLQSSLDLGKLK